MAAQDSDTNHEIQTLLRSGLRLFSLGDVERANEQWNQALDLVDDHETATDYLTNSLVSLEGGNAAALMNASPSVLDENEEAIDDITEVHNLVVENIKESNLEKALVLLEYGRANFEKGEHRFSRVSKLVRNLLSLRYVVDLGPLHQLIDAAETASADDLSAEEMHILALVDVSASQEGLTIDDLLTDSLYGPFKTLRALVTLRDRDYVRLRAPDAPPPSPEEVTVTARESEATDESDAAEPGATEPDAAEPDAAEPDAAEPDAADDGAGDAVADQTGDETGDADAVGDEASVMDESADDEPGGDGAADEEAASDGDAPDGVVGSTGDTDAEAETAPSLDDDFNATFSKAVGAYVQGEFGKARELFEACADMRPDDPRPQSNLDRLDALGK